MKIILVHNHVESYMVSPRTLYYVNNFLYSIIVFINIFQLKFKQALVKLKVFVETLVRI